MRFENKPVAWAVTGCFALFLLALLVVPHFVQPEEYSFFENRYLAEKPAVEKDGILSGTWFSACETYLVDHAAWRTTLVEWNTRLDLALRKPVVNTVVVQKDQLLPYLDYEPEPDLSAIEEQALAVTENLTAHRDLVESYGGHFCYVAVPSQYVCLADRYPWYLENRCASAAASARALFRHLDAAGIDRIDIYPIYLSYTEEQKARYISKVDHHYTMFGAYETYLQMMDQINGDWKGAVPVLTEDAFTMEAVENTFVGSRDRMLFHLFQSGESLYCIRPEEEIPFTRYDEGVENTATVYSLPYDPQTYVTYSVYMGGDCPWTTIDTGREDLPSVLIYGDSFTNAVESIAWYSFGRMDSVDLRHYQDRSLNELLEELRPDYVFCIRDYSKLLETADNGQ